MENWPLKTLKSKMLISYFMLTFDIFSSSFVILYQKDKLRHELLCMVRGNLVISNGDISLGGIVFSDGDLN